MNVWKTWYIEMCGCNLQVKEKEGKLFSIGLQPWQVKPKDQWKKKGLSKICLGGKMRRNENDVFSFPSKGQQTLEPFKGH